MYFSLSPSKAFAVSATIGICFFFEFSSKESIFLVASTPPIMGIWISMKMMSYSQPFLELNASAPLETTVTFIPNLFNTFFISFWLIKLSSATNALMSLNFFVMFLVLVGDSLFILLSISSEFRTLVKLRGLYKTLSIFPSVFRSSTSLLSPIISTIFKGRSRKYSISPSVSKHL